MRGSLGRAAEIVGDGDAAFDRAAHAQATPFPARSCAPTSALSEGAPPLCGPHEKVRPESLPLDGVADMRAQIASQESIKIEIGAASKKCSPRHSSTSSPARAAATPHARLRKVQTVVLFSAVRFTFARPRRARRARRAVAGNSARRYLDGGQRFAAQTFDRIARIAARTPSCMPGAFRGGFRSPCRKARAMELRPLRSRRNLRSGRRALPRSIRALLHSSLSLRSCRWQSCSTRLRARAAADRPDDARLTQPNACARVAFRCSTHPERCSPRSGSLLVGYLVLAFAARCHPAGVGRYYAGRRVTFAAC